MRTRGRRSSSRWSSRSTTGCSRALLFVDRPHPYIRRVITSLLAGNVFDPEARWVADARTRLTREGMLEMLASG